MYTESIVLHEYETGDEVKLDVEFYYSPPRRQTMIDPAEEEEFELNCIKIDGNEKCIEDVEWEECDIIDAIKEQCVP